MIHKRIFILAAAAHYNLGITYLVQGPRKLALDQYEIPHGLGAQEADHLFEKIYPESQDGSPAGHPVR
jgi:hypothetical protein